MSTTATLRQGTVSAPGATLSLIEAGEADAPTIVLVHGYPDGKELWVPVMQRLSEHFHVVAYDVRGAGESSAPRGVRAYGFEPLAGDLAAVLDAVSPQRPVHLVGHDWGAIQGWELSCAPLLAPRIASFTAVAGPALGHVRSALRRQLRQGRVLHAASQLRHSWYIVGLCTPGVPTLVWRGVLGRGVWEAYLRLVERIPTEGTTPAATLTRGGICGANLYRRNILLGLAGKSPARPRMPVQLILPSGDRFLPPGYYETVEDYVPTLRRRILAGSHWAPRAQPELVSRWIAEFAGEVDGQAVAAVPAASIAPRARPWVRGGGLDQVRGRLALVTGAGSGIGHAVAAALDASGARVVLVDCDGEAAQRAAHPLRDAVALTCDVADPQAMEELRDRVLAERGVPSVVVNNAGIGVAGPFLATGLEEWRRILDINLMGVIHGCRLFGQAMVQSGDGGHLVNTASAAAFWPSKDLPAYSTSKAAVLMLSECLRAELAPSGIGVTALCPGIVATNITRTTRYVGRRAGEQDRLRDQVTRFYSRRNFTPDQVAAAVLEAIARDRPLAVVTPEAKLMRALSRFAPGAARRLAGVDALPA